MTQEEISKAFVERTADPFFETLGSQHTLGDSTERIWAGYLFAKYGDAKYTPTEIAE